MNKHQRAKSRLIKGYIRIAREQGVNISYKQAKRTGRKIQRYVIGPVLRLPKGLIKWGKRLRYEASVASDSMRQFGLTAHTYLIDETPPKEGETTCT